MGGIVGGDEMDVERFGHGQRIIVRSGGPRSLYNAPLQIAADGDG